MNGLPIHGIKQIEIFALVLIGVIFILGLILGWPIELIVGAAIMIAILALAYMVSPVLATAIIILYLIGSIVAWNRFNRYRNAFRNIAGDIVEKVRQ